MWWVGLGWQGSQMTLLRPPGSLDIGLVTVQMRPSVLCSLVCSWYGAVDAAFLVG